MRWWCWRSSVVWPRGGRAGVLESGDRAPDGASDDGRRLFDVFQGPHFTLLAVGTDAELPASAEAMPRTHRVAACPAYGTGLFFVRPDGYIGWGGHGHHRAGGVRRTAGP